MPDATKLLFEEKFRGKALFISQLELVNVLLTNPQTKYYVDSSAMDKYSKAQTRLKTYISQLLSSTVSRTVTEDFKDGLKLAVSSRPNITDEEVEVVVPSILNSIDEKNSRVPKSEAKSIVEDQFGTDFHRANYIAIITSTPLDIDDTHRSQFPPLRRYLFTDLIERLYDKDSDLKYYRFNFPIESFGQLFWRLLKRVLVKQFKQNFSSDLMESLYYKFAVKTDTALSVGSSDKVTDEDIEKVTNEVLSALNHNKFLRVFTNMAPVYTFPLIAMDPSERKNIRVYAMLDSDATNMTLHKFPDNETLLWRIFVWDALKSKKYAGQEVAFSSDFV